MNEPTLTEEEKQCMQQYAMSSISRDVTKRPKKNTALESVIYWWQEAMRPAPPALKEQVKSELSSALNNWRTA